MSKQSRRALAQDIYDSYANNRFVQTYTMDSYARDSSYCQSYREHVYEMMKQELKHEIGTLMFEKIQGQLQWSERMDYYRGALIITLSTPPLVMITGEELERKLFGLVGR